MHHINSMQHCGSRERAIFKLMPKKPTTMQKKFHFFTNSIITQVLSMNLENVVCQTLYILDILKSTNIKPQH